MENNTEFKLRIRASAAGYLMGGGRGITEKQLVELDTLLKRKEAVEKGTAKPLKDMDERIAELIAKRDAKPELGETAKSYIRRLWLKIKYGYEKPLITPELRKGNLCEQEGMDLVSVLWPGEFRRKNEQRYFDEHFDGTPDTLLEKEPDVVEDTKSTWSIETFFDKTEIDPIYFAQGQVYMHLTTRKKFRVHYCLMNTPKELVEAEKRSFFWKMGGEDSEEYRKVCEQIDRNHNVDKIPLHERLKTFEFDYDPEFIAELQKKVLMAREYFDSLKLNRQ